MSENAQYRDLDNHEENLRQIEHVMHNALILAQDNLYKTGRIILAVVSGSIVLSFNHYADKLAYYKYSWLLFSCWIIGLAIITLFILLMVNSQRSINLFSGYLIQSRSLMGTLLLKIKTGELTANTLWQSDEYIKFKKIIQIDPIKKTADLYDKGYMIIMGFTALFFITIILFAIINACS